MPDLEILELDAADFPLDALAEIQNVIVDPPYSRKVHAKATSVGQVGGSGRGVHARDLGFTHLTPKLRHALARIIARVDGYSAVFSDLESAHVWRHAVAAAGAEYIREIPCDDPGDPYAGALPWIRWSQPQLSGDRPPTGAELLSVFWGRPKTRKAWNGPGGLVSLRRRSLRGADKHPTEKPLDLMLDLVSWFSAPGATILDPCAGRATTGQACRLLGRGFVGLELDAAWADAGRQRLAGPFTDHERVRAEEWCLTTQAEALDTPYPQRADGADRKTWERAQRRLADVDRVAEALGY